MSIDSMLYGKNRHMFGGIEPGAIKSMSAVLRRIEGTNTASVRIKIELPDDTVIPNSSGVEQVVCSVGGAIVRKGSNITGFTVPQNEFDGEEIAILTESGEITDVYTYGDTVGYAAFPFSTQGVHNRSQYNTSGTLILNTTEDVTPTYLYGFDIDTADSNPSTRVSYPSDVDNADFTPFSSYTDSGEPIYGDWNLVAGHHFMPKPCMLKYDGTVDHYLNPNNYDLKEDGSASSVADALFEGNAMMEWPKIYTKRWDTTDADGNTIYHFRCSDIKIDDDWDCWCNYDVNNNEIDHFYTAIYSGGIDENDRLRSLSGSAWVVDNADEINAMYTYAGNNSMGGGNDWTISMLSDTLLIWDLRIMLQKSTDVITTNIPGTRGALNDKGLFWCSDTGKTFGMEADGPGAGGGLVAGMSIGYSVSSMQVKITLGTHDGTTKNGFKTWDTYEYTWLYIPIPSDPIKDEYYIDSGYIKAMRTYSWGRMPADLSGSSTTYECQGFSYYNRTKNDAMAHSTSNGAFVNLDHYWHDTAAAALSCKPCLTTE